MRHLRSVRARITALAAVITIVVLVAIAALVVVVMDDQLRDLLDRSLEQRADQLSTAAVDPPSVLPGADQADHFAQVLDADGRVVASTANLSGRPAVVEPPTGDQRFSTRDDVPIEDDAYRVLVRRSTADGATRFVVVGENVDDVRDAVRSLVIVLAWSIPLAVIVLAVVVWGLVGRTLRPVERIRREVAGVGLTELHRRIPLPGGGDEIDELARTMNDMLARLEASAERQRRFVADASHELRSPLTRMRTALEVDLAQRSDDDPHALATRRTLADVIELQGLVEDLLVLARHDAAGETSPGRPVDLDAIVEEVARSRRASAGVTIDLSAVSAAEIVGRRAELTRVVDNLLSNAVRHARTRVEVALVERDGSVELVVDDDGPGIPPADRRRVTERFVRLDDARDVSGGAGLGLALVHDIAVAHGASLDIADAPLGGARVSITFRTNGPTL